MVAHSWMQFVLGQFRLSQIQYPEKRARFAILSTRPYADASSEVGRNGQLPGGPRFVHLTGADCALSRYYDDHGVTSVKPRNIVRSI